VIGDGILVDPKFRQRRGESDARPRPQRPSSAAKRKQAPGDRHSGRKAARRQRETAGPLIKASTRYDARQEDRGRSRGRRACSSRRGTTTFPPGTCYPLRHGGGAVTFSEQWFCAMKTLADPAVGRGESAGEVRFQPDRWSKVYLDWMGETSATGCISRQIWWGHRIPVWDLRQQARRSPAVGRTRAACPECKSTDLRQDSDVLDTWFLERPSGLSRRSAGRRRTSDLEKVLSHPGAS